jgi:hypothetical protein
VLSDFRDNRVIIFGHTSQFHEARSSVKDAAKRRLLTHCFYTILRRCDLVRTQLLHSDSEQNLAKKQAYWFENCLTALQIRNKEKINLLTIIN